MKIKRTEKSADSYRTPKPIKKAKHKDTRIPVTISAIPVSTVSTAASSPISPAKTAAIATCRAADYTLAVTAPEEKLFPCPHCPKTYVNARALGGHASKMHAGMSATYNNKVKVREARVHERNARNIAKHLYKVLSSAPTDDKNQRSIVTRVKKIIQETRPEAIEQGDATALPVSFYESLAEELRSGEHGKANVYRDHFNLKSAKRTDS